MLKAVQKFSLGTIFLIIGLFFLVACGEGNQNSTVISLPSATAGATTQTTATSAATGAASTATPVAASPANVTTRAATTSVATSGASSPTQTPRATTTAAVGQATPAGTPAINNVPTVGVDDSVKQEIDRISRQVEKTRGLTFTGKVESYFMTRNDLAKYQEADFRKSNPPSEISRYTKILETLGFVPKGFDLARVYIDLLNEQVLGFYDPETKKLYMVVESDPNKLTPLVKFTAEHELTHGVQDQVFDLKKFRPTAAPGTTEWNDDKDYALTALIEGDATQSQLLWIQGGNLSSNELQDMLKDINNVTSSELDKAPLILKDTLTFPYEAGANFVQQLYKNGGWAAVDKAFRDYPPQSTSQIINFDKYQNRKEPVAVQLPNTLQILGGDWKTLGINTMGELQTRIWLEAAQANDKAKAGAKGWAGDRYQVIENSKNETGYIWRSEWDTDSDADEFGKAAITTLTKIHGLGSPTNNGGSYTWSSATQDVALVIKDRKVLISVLPKGAGVDKLVKAAGF